MATKKTPGVAAKQPLSLWKKPVKLQTGKFAAAFGRGIYDAASGDWKAGAGDVEKALEAIGLSAEPGEIAWKLVVRGMVRAIFDLLEDSPILPAAVERPDRERFVGQVEQAIGGAEIALERSFFDRPGDLPVLGVLAPSIEGWLVAHGAAPAEARGVVQRWPVYFTYALHQEWHERAAEYAPLLATLDTPFAKADARARAWERYAARLARQIHEPMLGEAFGLAKVFVPLRGYHEVAKEPEGPRGRRGSGPEERGPVVRHVLDVGDELDAWADGEGKEGPALRVVAGGPGSGKSSLAKMFAARVAGKGKRALYVPLHLIDPEKDLEAAIGQFVRQQDILTENPLDSVVGERRLLLLLDGLDELAMQGRAAAEVARKFVEEARRLVENRNHDGVRLQVLLGGRELVVQMCRSELRKERQVVHLLPYWVAEPEREWDKESWVDPGKLIEADHRDVWWRRYGEAKGKGYQGMPAELRRADLDEVTAQPLLGYLVALGYEGGQVDFSQGSELDRNVIYKDLIRRVHERTYAGERHPAVGGLSLDSFVQLLEEVGLATWHGDGRTTTVAAIHALCKKSGLDRLLDQFQEGAESGATRLLTAFYFRQRRGDGDRTFEFTHKSFGEYLAARRMVRALEAMREEMARRAERPGKGWSEREALGHWAEVAGPSAMDAYILRFLVGELKGTEKGLAVETQTMLARLIGYLLREGMPMEELGARPTYAEEARQARNAEEALLAGLYACSERTEEMSQVAWPEATSFGAWIRRLQGQRRGSGNVVALESLARLNLSGQVIDFIDCYGANFRRAHLAGVHAYGANLLYTTLEGANLEGANLRGANLERANFRGANLEGANLEGAHLRGANLRGAHVADATLERANLERALRSR